jgi:small subunit ribosomal protein S2
MPFINERWLGGMLTNFQTISKRVSKMKDYERMRDAGEFEAMPKKEALMLSRELDKLERNLGGIRDLERLPDAIFVLDTKKEDIAVTEANKLGIPIVAVVDTNCDPDVIDYVIPGNDDAIRSANLMSRIVSDAVLEGRFIASRKGGAPGGPPIDRTADEEAKVAQQQAEARRQAALAAAEREARLAETQAQSAAETARVAEPQPQPTEPHLTPENASNLLDDLATTAPAPDKPLLDDLAESSTKTDTSSDSLEE